MFSAYVLVQVSAKDPRAVAEKIRKVAGVKQAHVAAGPTDCFAFIEGPELEALTATVMAIRAVEGVKKTDTRLAVA